MWYEPSWQEESDSDLLTFQRSTIFNTSL